MLVNVHRDSDTRREPFTLEEVVGWLGHGFVESREMQESPPPTVEELRERAILLNDVYGGRRNGDG